jgi:hypothetical protein
MPFETATNGAGLLVSDMFAVKMAYPESHGSRHIYDRPLEPQPKGKFCLSHQSGTPGFGITTRIAKQ